VSISKKPYKGTRDFFPTQKRMQNYFFSKMSKAAESFGYEPYDGPMLEEVELYKAKSGEELINDQIYSFTDRGERFVAIRPEMTPTVARMVSQVHKEVSKPIRWYSIPNLYRYERPQKGRLREHWQFNCDIFGANDIFGELEILQIAINLFKSFGADHTMFEILLNDREIVDNVFKEVLKVDEETSYKLYKIIDRYKKVTPEAFDKTLNELNLDANCIKELKEYLKLNKTSDVIEYLKSKNLSDTSKRLENLSTHLNLLQLSDFIVYDPTIVRGLDYYTGLVFEIFDKNPDNRRALCGGGSYANLLKIFNEPELGGTGFGLGDVTLENFLVGHKLLPEFSTPKNDILITFQDDIATTQAMQVASELREQGLKVITTLDKTKINKVFNLAEKKGTQFVALIGSDEVTSKSIQIKNIKTKSQEQFKITDITKIQDYLKV
jgi:histidyl-tRNA synthetase